MSCIKAILLIFIFFSLAYYGYEDNISSDKGQMRTKKMCAKKPVSKEQPYNSLSLSEKEVLKFIFNFVLKSGKTPTPKEIARATKSSDKDIIHILDELESNDLLLRREGTQEIISIYPFSMEVTHHQIFLEDGKRLFAMCAVDALGMPAMFDKDIRIVSRCEKCKQKITVEIRNEEIVSKSHPTTLIWRTSRKEGRPSAETCCPEINFFCSEEHVKEWKAENPELAERGRAVPLKLAFPEIERRWKKDGKSIGFR